MTLDDVYGPDQDAFPLEQEAEEWDEETLGLDWQEDEAQENLPRNQLDSVKRQDSNCRKFLEQPAAGKALTICAWRRLYRRTGKGTAVWRRQDPRVPLEFRRILGIDQWRHATRTACTQAPCHSRKSGCNSCSRSWSRKASWKQSMLPTPTTSISPAAWTSPACGRSGSDTVKVDPWPGVLCSGSPRRAARRSAWSRQPR